MDQLAPVPSYYLQQAAIASNGSFHASNASSVPAEGPKPSTAASGALTVVTASTTLTAGCVAAFSLLLVL